MQRCSALESIHEVFIIRHLRLTEHTSIEDVLAEYVKSGNLHIISFCDNYLQSNERKEETIYKSNMKETSLVLCKSSNYLFVFFLSVVDTK